MAKLIDLTGKRFGRLTVLYRGLTIKRCAVWLAQCDCTPDAKIHVRGAALRNGLTRSCGCLRVEKARDRGFDLTGKVFGCWQVLKPAPTRGLARYWVCVCSCPKHTQREVSTTSLLKGRSRSCHRAGRKAAPSEEMPIAA